MERRPDIGLDSYDRFFPNQDTPSARRLRKLNRLAITEAAAGIGE